MDEPNSDASSTKGAGDTVTTRVNVAFPFSRIEVQEPSEDLVALATLVRELADLVVEISPGPAGEELQTRARELAARLH